MMGKKDEVPKFAFYSVALAAIAFGAAVMAFGIVTWFMNVYGSGDPFYLPSLKIIGGAVIILLGYIHLELELIRSSK